MTDLERLEAAAYQTSQRLILLNSGEAHAFMVFAEEVAKAVKEEGHRKDDCT